MKTKTYNYEHPILYIMGCNQKCIATVDFSMFSGEEDMALMKNKQS